VSEDLPLEEAARIMVDRRIGGMPVMREQTLAGIITETDLFKTLLEMLGGRRSGVRVTVSVPGVKGTLAKIANAVFDAGGNIVGLGVSEVSGSSEMQ
jgi:acetoin utilization protein AcuB